MNRCQSNNCKGTMRETVLDRVDYRLCLIDDAVVLNARVEQCDTCSAVALMESQMRLWDLEILKQLLRRGTRLQPQEVRFLRKSLVLTQRQLAAYLGVSATQFSRWESHEESAPSRVASRLMLLIAIERLDPAVGAKARGELEACLEAAAGARARTSPRMKTSALTVRAA